MSRVSILFYLEKNFIVIGVNYYLTSWIGCDRFPVLEIGWCTYYNRIRWYNRNTIASHRPTNHQKHVEYHHQKIDCPLTFLNEKYHRDTYHPKCQDYYISVLFVCADERITSGYKARFDGNRTRIPVVYYPYSVCPPLTFRLVRDAHNRTPQNLVDVSCRLRRILTGSNFILPTVLKHFGYRPLLNIYNLTQLFTVSSKLNPDSGVEP